MSTLDGIGLTFEETMSGYISEGANDPVEGAVRGRDQGSRIGFSVKITISDLARFLSVSKHEAELSGTVTCDCGRLRGTFPISDGVFNLFTVGTQAGQREMSYTFRFQDGAGQTYLLRGHKEIYDDPGMVDVVEDMTKLFTTIHEGADSNAPVYGAGQLYFKMRDAPSMVASMQVIGATSLRQRAMAYTAFMSFAYGSLRDVYLGHLRITYDTRYENLVLSGQVEFQGSRRPFFLVSGEHDMGFPWGDGETFSDVLLVIGDGNGGYRRYCISDRTLDGLDVDVKRGKYSYRGMLFSVDNGYAAFVSDMRKGSGPNPVKHQAELHIDFTAAPYDEVPFPFPTLGKLINKLPSALARELRAALPSEHRLGMYITPYAVTVTSGRLSLTDPQTGPKRDMNIEPGATYGEAERSEMRNFKGPTLLYGYICAVQPDAKTARVQIHTRTLRDEKERWAKDRLDAFLGSVISRIASADILLKGGRRQAEVRDWSRRNGRNRRNGPPPVDELFKKLGEPLLEVNNNHYPTAVFQRRIIRVLDPSGAECLALEEDMTRMRREAIGSEREVIVASILDEDKRAALKKVLEETNCERAVEQCRRDSGKDKDRFSIVIKPNFMFAYDKRDRSTYTDPELVEYLVKWLRDKGFTRISVVEAQSTYGEYFDKRSVAAMAAYLGFKKDVDDKDVPDYDIVDLTKEATGHHYLGPHLGETPVSPTWRDADFRISFAKNKTHAYAYYTLTLKNIYGTLPLGNKFKEYHCDRDIYHTTIEYLKRFPVHFGLVDAYLSADGPFGIFADTDPNHTHTIIGGPDLVAVDWVAATKMGIDPMLSEYMSLAVVAFGKPKITVIGDANPYRPWLNAPMALILATNNILDANHYFGNLFYMACSQMDERHFKLKNNALWLRMLRGLSVPMRRAFFLRTGENPSWLNRLANRFFHRMGY